MPKLKRPFLPDILFEEVSSQDGIVSYAASTVKFIWMTLPESPEFEVVYRLVPKQNEPRENMVIEGLLTYTSGNENKLVEVKEMDVAIEDLSAVQKKTLLIEWQNSRAGPGNPLKLFSGKLKQQLSNQTTSNKRTTQQQTERRTTPVVRNQNQLRQSSYQTLQVPQAIQLPIPGFFLPEQGSISGYRWPPIRMPMTHAAISVTKGWLKKSWWNSMRDCINTPLDRSNPMNRR